MTSIVEDPQAFRERNRAFFDSAAVTIYEHDWAAAMTAQIADFIKAEQTWLGVRDGPAAGRLLDYAGGNGVVVSLPLLERFAELRSIDASPAMAAEYNRTAARAGVPAARMRAVVGDLLGGAGEGEGEGKEEEQEENFATPEWTGFDLVAMSMALHHVHDPARMVAVLAARLAPGGTLVLVDFVAAEESGCRPLGGHGHGHGDHGHHHHGGHGHGEAAPEKKETPTPPPAREPHPSDGTISRHGFYTAEIRDYCAAAGLADVEFRLPARTPLPDAMGGEQQLFVARARRAA